MLTPSLTGPPSGLVGYVSLALDTPYGSSAGAYPLQGPLATLFRLLSPLSEPGPKAGRAGKALPAVLRADTPADAGASGNTHCGAGWRHHAVNIVRAIG